MNIPEDEFIEYIAWCNKVSTSEAKKWWDELPKGTEVCSFAMGCVTKQKESVIEYQE